MSAKLKITLVAVGATVLAASPALAGMIYGAPLSDRATSRVAGLNAQAYAPAPQVYNKSDVVKMSGKVFGQDPDPNVRLALRKNFALGND